MKCKKCGSIKFYIKSVDITYNNDFSKLSRQEIEENLDNGNYINFDWSKGYSRVICSNCGTTALD
jgi:predicted nucleic-acid-binding Zn-ribbon protein